MDYFISSNFCSNNFEGMLAAVIPNKWMNFLKLFQENLSFWVNLLKSKTVVEFRPKGKTVVEFRPKG